MWLVFRSLAFASLEEFHFKFFSFAEGNVAGFYFSEAPTLLYRGSSGINECNSILFTFRITSYLSYIIYIFRRLFEAWKIYQ